MVELQQIRDYVIARWEGSSTSDVGESFVAGEYAFEEERQLQEEDV